MCAWMGDQMGNHMHMSSNSMMEEREDKKLINLSPTPVMFEVSLAGSIQWASHIRSYSAKL